MENQISSRTTKSDIGGTVYVVESRISVSAKESAYSKLKRLITVNAKSLSKLSDSSNKSTEINSTSSR
ncbi:transposon-encoded TnpW family protein [Desulfofalx alkaliphila]|uniref:transposon-encoded TnpW family protein n=1 Tax=Desulfofalx alkaliphila TaxID=105483 RepID=UPI0004E140C3|nr:transposon-encoded TnpW family protein [Desulfofalx alkaliphila]